MQDQSNKSLDALKTLENTPDSSTSYGENFGDLYGNKKYNVAIYAGVIIGTKLRSLENTGFRRFNPNRNAFEIGETT